MRVCTHVIASSDKIELNLNKIFLEHACAMFLNYNELLFTFMRTIYRDLHNHYVLSVCVCVCNELVFTKIKDSYLSKYD